MTEKSNKRTGRPRTFDRDEALLQAMHVFWKQGYSGASMPQLVEAIGVNSPSIYAAFGSKEDLFRAAVRLYGESAGPPAWRALNEQVPLREAIWLLMSRLIEACAKFDNPRGCLLTLGYDYLGDGDAPVRQFLREQRNLNREALRQRMERAKEEGDLPSDMDIEQLSASAFTFLMGISIELADGVPSEILLAAARKYVDLIFAR